MEALAAGQIVSVDFPFSDRSVSKIRPAMILASAMHGDYLMAPIPSNPFADPDAVAIDDDSFESGGLKRPSFLRPTKLYTANQSCVYEVLGTLHKAMHETVAERICETLRREIRESR
jgi:mRNA interferase MazF